MRERSLDEFESIFEQASIPAFDIDDIPLTRMAAVLKGGPLDEAILTVSGYLKDRFAAQVQLHWSGALAGDQVRRIAAVRGLMPASDPFASTAELVGQVSIARSQLVCLSEPENESARLVDLDALVEGTAPPILLIRAPIEQPSSTFHNILHSLTGNFQQKRNFAYSFKLVQDDGALLLLHTIDQGQIQDVREALQVSPDIAGGSREELLRKMARHGERYLKAVVAASRERPFEVSYRLAVGPVVSAVRQELATGKFGLLVVGSHREGRSQVSADDYRLMRQVRDLPVLAL